MPVPFHEGVTIVPFPNAGAPVAGTWDAGTLIVDSLGVVYKCSVTGTPGTWTALIAGTPPPDLVLSFPEFIDTFPNGVQAGMGWLTSLSGGGALLSQIAPPSGAGGRNQVIGVISVGTGTNTGGRAGATLGTTLLRFETAVYTLWARVHMTQLADATNNYRFRIGFIDDASATEPTDGVYFEYQFGTSNNWLCKSVSNNSRTIVTSSVAVQNANWNDLKIEVNGTTQIATFSVDDVVIGTIDTNIPTAAGRETSIGMVIAKTAGGTSRAVSIDRIYMKLS